MSIKNLYWEQVAVISVDSESSYKSLAFPILQEIGWLTVSNVIETETLKMVYRSKNQLAPEYLNSMLIKLSEFRNSFSIVIPIFMSLY